MVDTVGSFGGVLHPVILLQRCFLGSLLWSPSRRGSVDLYLTFRVGSRIRVTPRQSFSFTVVFPSIPVLLPVTHGRPTIHDLHYDRKGIGILDS